MLIISTWSSCLEVLTFGYVIQSFARPHMIILDRQLLFLHTTGYLVFLVFSLGIRHWAMMVLIDYKGSSKGVRVADVD